MGADAIRWWTGVALSLVVPGANRHVVWQLKGLLDAIMVERPGPPHKHLCADADYSGAPALKVIENYGYISHVKGKRTISVAKYWCDMRSLIAAFWRSTTWWCQSWRSERSNWTSMLFTDKF